MPDASPGDQPRLSRRWLYGPFIVAGVILAGYYGLWRAGANAMKREVAAWAEDQRALGGSVSYDRLQAEGFPFFLRVRVDAPAVVAAEESWRWRGDALYLDALPYDLDRLIFSPRGEQFIETQDAGRWRLVADDLRASIASDGARGWIFSANLGEAVAERAHDGARVSVGVLVLDLAPEAGAPSDLTLSLAASDVTSDLEERALAVDRLQTVMTLTNADLLTATGDAGPWRAAGGALQIAGLIAELDEASFSAAGALTLDDAGRPDGALKAELRNPAGLAPAIAALGGLSTEEAEAAVAGLALAAMAGGGRIAAPIEFSDGAARIGGVKLAELPSLEVVGQP